MSEMSQPTVVEQGVNQFFATFERAQNSASVRSAFGEPVTYGETVVVPVASVTQMFGLGLGVGSSASEADESARPVPKAGIGGGGTGRVTARPVAMAEITPDGLDIHPVIDENRAVVAGVLFAAWAVFWAARTLIKLFK